MLTCSSVADIPVLSLPLLQLVSRNPAHKDKEKACSISTQQKPLTIQFQTYLGGKTKNLNIFALFCSCNLILENRQQIIDMIVTLLSG